MAVGLKPANKLVQGAAIPGAMGHQADQAAMEDRVVQAVAVGAAQVADAKVFNFSGVSS